MKFAKSKWLAYTFLVGLIPVLIRLLAWIITKSGTVNALSASDFVAFGLVLHISIINELEHLPTEENSWKTIQNGTSVIFIVLYGALYVLTVIGERNGNLFDANIMMKSVIVIASISAIISFLVVHRISKLSLR